jgi:pimeloyl-ACP methyl ester carboxylesterase
MSYTSTSEGARNVVLLHGAWADGSGWEDVYHALGREGYAVRVAQHSTASLDGDVAAARRIMASLDGPVVLVGHSYGGAVITEAGNDPRVAALVYVAGWVPDAGESVATLIGTPWPDTPPDAATPPILPPQDGFLLLDRARFHGSFAADLPAGTGAFLADAQLPWGEAALTGTITSAAWRSKPSWYLVASDDRMIPPAWQRGMARRAGAAVTEVAASHAVYVSQPQAVVSLVQRAAAGARATAAAV